MRGIVATVALGLAGVMIGAALWPTDRDEDTAASPPNHDPEPGDPAAPQVAPEEAFPDPMADAAPPGGDEPAPTVPAPTATDDELALPPEPGGRPEGPVGAPLAGRLAVELWTPRPTIERDEAIDLRMRLRNIGTTPLRVLRPVEGHQWGIRTVAYSVGIYSAHDTVAPPWFGSDPRFACLTDADVVTLAPSETLDIAPDWRQQPWSGSVNDAGSHTFTAWYSVRAARGGTHHQAELDAAAAAGASGSAPRARQDAVRQILESVDSGAVRSAPLTIVRR